MHYAYSESYHQHPTEKLMPMLSVVGRATSYYFFFFFFQAAQVAAMKNNSIHIPFFLLKGLLPCTF